MNGGGPSGNSPDPPAPDPPEAGDICFLPDPQQQEGSDDEPQQQEGPEPQQQQGILSHALNFLTWKNPPPPSEASRPPPPPPPPSSSSTSSTNKSSKATTAEESNSLYPTFEESGTPSKQTKIAILDQWKLFSSDNNQYYLEADDPVNKEKRVRTGTIASWGFFDETAQSSCKLTNRNLELILAPGLIVVTQRGGRYKLETPLGQKMVENQQYPPHGPEEKPAASNGSLSCKLTSTYDELNIFLEGFRIYVTDFVGKEKLPKLPDEICPPPSIKQLSPSGMWELVLSTKEGKEIRFNDHSVEFLVLTYDYLARVEEWDENPRTGYIKYIHKNTPKTSAFMREQYDKFNEISRLPKNSPLSKNSPLLKNSSFSDLPEEESSCRPHGPEEKPSAPNSSSSSESSSDLCHNQNGLCSMFNRHESDRVQKDDDHDSSATIFPSTSKPKSSNRHHQPSSRSKIIRHDGSNSNNQTKSTPKANHEPGASDTQPKPASSPSPPLGSGEEESMAAATLPIAAAFGTEESPLPLTHEELVVLVRKKLDFMNQNIPTNSMPALPDGLSVSRLIEEDPTRSKKWKVFLFAKDKKQLKHGARFATKKKAVFFYDLICDALHLPTTKYYNLVLNSRKTESMYVSENGSSKTSTQRTVSAAVGQAVESGVGKLIHRGAEKGKKDHLIMPKTLNDRTNLTSTSKSSKRKNTDEVEQDDKGRPTDTETAGENMKSTSPSPAKPADSFLNGASKNATRAKRKASDMTGDIERNEKKQVIEVSTESPTLMNRVEETTRYNASTTPFTETNETETADDHNGHDLPIDGYDDRRESESSKWDDTSVLAAIRETQYFIEGLKNIPKLVPGSTVHRHAVQKSRTSGNWLVEIEYRDGTEPEPKQLDYPKIRSEGVAVLAYEMICSKLNRPTTHNYDLFLESLNKNKSQSPSSCISKTGDDDDDNNKDDFPIGNENYDDGEDFPIGDDIDDDEEGPTDNTSHSSGDPMPEAATAADDKPVQGLKDSRADDKSVEASKESSHPTTLSSKMNETDPADDHDGSSIRGDHDEGDATMKEVEATDQGSHDDNDDNAVSPSGKRRVIKRQQRRAAQLRNTKVTGKTPEPKRRKLVGEQPSTTNGRGSNSIPFISATRQPTTLRTEMNETETVIGNDDDDVSPSINVDTIDEVMAGSDDDDGNTSFRSCMYAGKKCFEDDPMPTPVYFNGLQFTDTLTPGMDISPDVMNGLVKLLQLNITHIHKNDTIIIINDPTFGAPPKNGDDEVPIVPLDDSSKDGNRLVFQAILINEKDGDVHQLGLGKSHGENPIGRWVLAIFDEDQRSATFHHWSPGSCSIFTENGKRLLRAYIQRTVHQIGFMNDSAEDNHVTVIWPDSSKAISPVPATRRERNEVHLSESIDTEAAYLTYCGSSVTEEDFNRSGVVVLKELIHRCFLITGRPDCQGDTHNAAYATGEYMKCKPSRLSSEEWLNQLSLDSAVSDLGSETNGFKPRIDANDREYIVKWYAVYFRRLLPTGVLAMPNNVLGTKDRQILKLQVKAAIAFSRIELIADPSSGSSMSSMDKFLDAIKFSMANALTPECCIEQGRRLMTCLDCGQISHSHHFSKFYESMDDWTCQYCNTGKRWIVLDQFFKVQREIEFPVGKESDTEDAISQRSRGILSSLLTRKQRQGRRRERAIEKSTKAGAKSPSSSPSKDELKAECIESKTLPLELGETTTGDKKNPFQRFVDSFIEQTVAGACPIPRDEAAKDFRFRSSSSSDVSCMPDSLENIISCMMTENGKDYLRLQNGRSIITISTLGSHLRSELNSCSDADVDDHVHADALHCSLERMRSVLDSMGISVDRQTDGSKKAILKQNCNCLAILYLPSTSVEGLVYKHCITWLPSRRLLIDNSEENVLQLNESVIQSLNLPVAGVTSNNRSHEIHKKIANKIFKKLVGYDNISIHSWYKISMKDEP